MRNIMDAINKISAKDRSRGTFAGEAYECMKAGKNMPALCSLFVLSEQAVKSALGILEGNFYNLSIKARNKGLITAEEFRILDNLREIRNKLFHEDHHSLFISDKNGTNFPVDESETWGMIFRIYAPDCLAIVAKLL